jgi:hypothetical protein
MPILGKNMKSGQILEKYLTAFILGTPQYKIDFRAIVSSKIGFILRGPPIVNKQ